MSSNNRLLFLKLNNYDYSKENIDAVKHYLETNQLPATLITGLQRKVFQNRYKPSLWEVRGAALYYKPLNLQCVPKEADKEPLLRELYNDPQIGTGAGIISFYHKVCSKYLGIKRKEVKAFLENQTAYQITKKPQRPINRPVIGEYPNHRWEADLIDMALYEGYNRKRKYILTVIDCFSKYVFAVPLVRKYPENIIEGLEQIHEKNGVYPVILQTDNGSEFKNNKMSEFCEEKKIRQVFTATHTPTSNGLVENFNLYLRKMIRETFVRTNNLNWVDYLDDLVINRNNTKHTTTKHTPAQIWKNTNTPIERPNRALPIHGDAVLNQNQILNSVFKRTETKAKKTLQRFNDEKLNVGDKVRIQLKAIDTKVRKIIKAGNEKLLPVKYTPEIYTVNRVYNSRKELAKPQYTLTEYGGKRFFASELQRVGGDAAESDINTDRLNQIAKLAP